MNLKAYTYIYNKFFLLNCIDSFIVLVYNLPYKALLYSKINVKIL